MRSLQVPCRLGAIGCLALFLAGCYPVDQNASDDNHPLIRAAEAQQNSNPQEAAKLLEKALAENPRLARAHWALGLICLHSTSNYAAAVYHFQKVLELRPDWPHAGTARQLIGQAKLDLVKEGVEAPTLPSVQRQMDRLVGELHRLTAEKTNLTTQVQYLTGLTQQLSAENLELRQRLLALNQPAPAASPVPSPATQPSPAPGRLANRPGAASSPPTRPAPNQGTLFPARPGDTTSPRLPASQSARTHVVQRGETAFAIGRRYGLSVRDLVMANPGLDPAHLRSGQRINLPAR